MSVQLRGEAAAFDFEACAIDGCHVCTVLNLVCKGLTFVVCTLLLVVSCICPSAAVAHACGPQHVQPLDGLMAVHKCMLHVSLGHCRNVFRFHIPLSFTNIYSCLLFDHLCLPDQITCKPDTVVTLLATYHHCKLDSQHVR